MFSLTLYSDQTNKSILIHAGEGSYDLQFGAKDLALVCSFAALYAVLSFVSLFPIIGSLGKFITLATTMAPLVGMILGPYLGATAVSIGGFIGWSIMQTGAFSFLSFVPGTFTALSSGLLYSGKQKQSLVLYAVLFLSMAFHPVVGPAWLYPYYLWFQLIGLIVLASPLTPLAINFKRKNDDLTRLSFSVGIICFVSTLIGQIAGSLMFELMYWPIIHSQVEYWRTAQWQFLTFVYPLERSIIVLVAILVGTPMIKTIRAYGYEIGGK